MPERLREIRLDPRSLSGFESLLGRERMAAVELACRQLAKRLEGRTLFTLTSEEWGSSITENRRALVQYARGAGVDARWLLIEGCPQFFELTRRLRDAIQGAGDPGSELLPKEARALYRRTARENALELAAMTRRGDLVILHDAETAGMIPHLSTGLHLIWRCHEATESRSRISDLAWDFLAPEIAAARGYVFPRPCVLPAGMDEKRVFFIPATLDPFSVKNRERDEASRRAILVHSGLLEPPPGEIGAPVFVRADGSPGRVNGCAEVHNLGRAPRWEDRLVVQIARWDRAKDAAGIMRGFARMVAEGDVPGVQLVLAGPDVHAHAENPWTPEVFEGVCETWRALPHSVRSRVHLATLPMDADENAAIVGALQRQAEVVVQKSLRADSGLAVAEAMWKAKPVVASDVAGIRERIDHGVDGILLEDPQDVDAFARALRDLLCDPEQAAAMGRRARQRAAAEFLDTSTIEAFAALVRELDL